MNQNSLNIFKFTKRVLKRMLHFQNWTFHFCDTCTVCGWLCLFHKVCPMGPIILHVRHDSRGAIGTLKCNTAVDVLCEAPAGYGRLRWHLRGQMPNISWNILCKWAIYVCCFLRSVCVMPFIGEILIVYACTRFANQTEHAKPSFQSECKLNVHVELTLWAYVWMSTIFH